MGRLLDPEIWKQEWSVLMSAPHIVVGLLVIVAVAVWWFSRKLSQSVIAGLREQTTVLEQRLHLAVDKSEIERKYQDALTRQLKDFKGAISSTQNNDDIASRVASLEATVARLVDASNMVRSAIIGTLNATEAPDTVTSGGIIE